MILLIWACAAPMDGACPNPDHPQVNYWEDCPEAGYYCPFEGWDVAIYDYWPESCGCGCVTRDFVDKWRRSSPNNPDWRTL